METQVKTETMEAELQKAISRYLKNAEKHLFVTKYCTAEKYSDGNYFKVIPVEISESLHYIKINISGDKINVKVNDTSWVKTKNHLGMMKNNVFYQWNKHKSIKRIPELQEKFDRIKELAGSAKNAESLKGEIEKLMK